ncbi:MAG: DUF5723 family protein [Flavitalea sp.]
MKSITLLICFLATTFQIFAQSFPGYRTSNYSGVNGVFFNPASIADSRFKFDLNLVSINTLFGNDQASFNLKDFNSSFDEDYILNQLEGSNSIESNGMLNVDIHGPSFMLNTGKKSAMAFSTRVRTIGNFRDMDVKLLRAFANELSDEESLPYNFASSNNMKLAFNAWSEIGLSYAREIKNEGGHFVKGGITIKYLGGIAGGFVNVNQLIGTLRDDGHDGNLYLENTTGRIGMGISRPGIENLDDARQRNFTSTGIGADIGFVYEFRPEHEKYTEENPGKDKNKYKLQVSVAVLDWGKLKSKTDQSQSGVYDMNVTGNEQFYVDEIDDLDLDDFNEFFQNRPDYFTKVNSSSTGYNYSLPTTLQIGADYHLRKGFYVNLAGQIPMAKENAMKPFNNKLYTSITLTPMFEGKTLGFYLPVQYNGLTGLNAGASMRLGPVFIGSGSALTALFGKSKQIDVHVGMKWGFLR